MEPTLQQRLREQAMDETALHRLRARLNPADQAALDAVVKSLGEFNTGAASTARFSPIETLLLLGMVRQHQKIECLELLLQRMSARVLEWYGESTPLLEQPGR